MTSQSVSGMRIVRVRHILMNHFNLVVIVNLIVQTVNRVLLKFMQTF